MFKKIFNIFILFYFFLKRTLQASKLFLFKSQKSLDDLSSKAENYFHLSAWKFFRSE
jgi:hypothetical protein